MVCDQKNPRFRATATHPLSRAWATSSARPDRHEFDGRIDLYALNMERRAGTNVLPESHSRPRARTAEEMTMTET
jgi:hypothetical protein